MTRRVAYPRRGLSLRRAPLAFAAAVLVATLGGCAPDGPAAVPDDGAAASAPAAPTAQEGRLVDARAFTFRIPPYWEDRVDCQTAVDADGNVVATVALREDKALTLAVLKMVYQQGEPSQTVDDRYHLVGYASGRSRRVEVWTYNWPLMVAQGAVPQAASEAELRALVDLQTGGALGYDECRAVQAESTVRFAESNYTRVALATTVRLR